MKKFIIIIWLTFLVSGFMTAASAQEVSFKSYFPAPMTSFNKIRLFPQAEIGSLGAECSKPGQLYFNSDQNMIYLCSPNDAQPATWGPLGGIWTQDGNDVYLNDTTDPILKIVSITPLFNDASERIAPFKLSLGNNAGILAKGTLGSGTDLTTTGPGTRFIWYPKKAAILAGGIPAASSFKLMITPSPTYITETTQWDNASIGNYSVNFGLANSTKAAHSSAIGGVGNMIDGISDGSTSLGGASKRIINAPFSVATGHNSLIMGANTYTAPYSVNFGTAFTDVPVQIYAPADYAQANVIILGGEIINSSYSFIGGNAGGEAHIGYWDKKSADYATILNARASIHGNPNIDTCNVDDKADYTFIGVGTDHEIEGDSSYSSIISGKGHKIYSASHSVIASGEANTIEGYDTGSCYEPISHAAIGGGQDNRVLKSYSTILGGKNNVAGGEGAIHATIHGGQDNKALAGYSFIGGGKNNRIGECVDVNADNICDIPVTKKYPTSMPADFSAIGGGLNNTILSGFAFIGSGQNNTIDDGGDNSFIPSGKNVSISGATSWASGRNVKVTGDRVWVWGYKSDEDASFIDTNGDGIDDDGVYNPITITDDDVFIFYAHPNPNGTIDGKANGPINEIKVGIGVNTPQYTLDVAGNIQASTMIISNMGTTANPGNGCIDASNEVGFCDIAEIFDATEIVSPGDVLIVDEASPALKLKKSTQVYDHKVVGIVSSTPAMTFEGDRMVGHGDKTTDTLRPPVALSGRVTCKVSLENGPIAKGDLLTTSSIPGHAMKATDQEKGFGSIIGKAMQSFNGGNNNEQTGEIIVFVGLQ